MSFQPPNNVVYLLMTFNAVSLMLIVINSHYFIIKVFEEIAQIYEIEHENVRETITKTEGSKILNNFFPLESNNKSNFKHNFKKVKKIQVSFSISF